MYKRQLGDLAFKPRPLPIEMQVSSVNAMVVEDFNGDGHLDFICGGNLYGAEVETPRNDASFGHVVLGDGDGNFNVLPYLKSGFSVSGEIRDLHHIQNRLGAATLLAVKNNDSAAWFELRESDTSIDD